MDPPRTTLCPGFKHVIAFSPALSSPKSKSKPTLLAEHGDESDESEYEEEIEYVTLDLGNIEPTLVPSSSTYRLIGLDTPAPYLQLSGTVLRGRHENLLGSELLFTDKDKDKDPPATIGPGAPGPPGLAGAGPGATGSGQKKKGVTHVSTTSKRISFREVRLRPKEKKGDANIQENLEGGEEDGGLEYADGNIGIVGVNDGGFVGDALNRGMNMDMNDDIGPGIGIGGIDMNMDADMDVDLQDALEYVDLDRYQLQAEPEAGPSTLPLASTPASSAPGPSVYLSLTPTFTPTPIPGSIPIASGKGKGKQKAKEPLAEAESGTADTPVDPALRIDRLTGISPPLTRTPRGSVGQKRKAPATSKGKGKQKERGAESDHMDTNEG